MNEAVWPRLEYEVGGGQQGSKRKQSHADPSPPATEYYYKNGSSRHRATHPLLGKTLRSLPSRHAARLLGMKQRPESKGNEFQDLGPR